LPLVALSLLAFGAYAVPRLARSFGYTPSAYAQSGINAGVISLGSLGVAIYGAISNSVDSIVVGILGFVLFGVLSVLAMRFDRRIRRSQNG
jgi:hypothetical protein